MLIIILYYIYKKEDIKMGWFTKKDSGVEKMPELPELPDSPNTDLILPESPDLPPPSPIFPSTPSVPSFPDQNKIPPPPGMPEKVTKDLSDANFRPQINEPRPGMQKSRFQQSESLPPAAKPSYTVPKFKESSYNLPDSNTSQALYAPPASNASQSSPYIPPAPYAPQHPQIQTPTSLQIPPIKSFPKKDDSVFIKLDKFQNTIEAFRDINQKIKEIEDLLLRTKEIKLREEKELEDWEREIEAIKLKLETISREIFRTEE